MIDLNTYKNLEFSSKNLCSYKDKLSINNVFTHTFYLDLKKLNRSSKFYSNLYILKTQWVQFQKNGYLVRKQDVSHNKKFFNYLN